LGKKILGGVVEIWKYFGGFAWVGGMIVGIGRDDNGGNMA